MESMAKPDTFDDILVAIARRTKKDAETDDLGRALQIPTHDIQGARVGNKGGTTHMGTLDMLRAWRERQPPSEEINKMKDALAKANMIRTLSMVFSEADTGIAPNHVFFHSDQKIYVGNAAEARHSNLEDLEDFEVHAIFESTSLIAKKDEALRQLVANFHNTNKWKENIHLCLQLAKLFLQQVCAELYKIEFGSVHFFVRVRLGADKDAFLNSCRDGTLSGGLTKLLVTPELEEAAGIKLKVRLDVVVISKARTFQTNVERGMTQAESQIIEDPDMSVKYTMDPNDIERLHRNWKDLLEVNSDDIMPDLIQDLIFDTDAMEEISHQGIRKKKTEMMLMKLTKRGPKAYPSFRKALQEFDVYHHLVQKLDLTQCGNLLVTQPSGDETDVGPSSKPGTLRSDLGPPTPAPEVARTPFTDLECLDLADLLDQERDFPRLGLCLKFPDPTLSRYRRENSGGSSSGTYKMLVDWKKQYLDYEHREHLSLALDNAGLKTLASQVRYGQKLEIVTSPVLYGASYSAMSCQSSGPTMPSTSGFNPPIDPPGSLRAPLANPIEIGQGLGLNTRLPRHTHPSHGNDVTDVDLFKLSRHFNLECYQRLGLSLGYTLDQLDAFKTKNCCDIPSTALDMLRNLKSHVGHIRKAEFKEFLDSQAQLPTLVDLL